MSIKLRAIIAAFLASFTFGTIVLASTWTNVQTDSSGNLYAPANFNASGTITIQGVAISTSTGGTPAGTSADVQFNNNGTFGADTGNFDYSTSSKQLTLSTPTSSMVIGSSTSSEFPTSSVQYTQTFSYTGAIASWTVPANVTSLTINVIGAGNADGNQNSFGGSATGTLTVMSGTVLYYAVGQSSASGCTATFGGGGAAPGCSSGAHAGNGMTWISTSTSFSTSTVLIVAGGAGGGVQNTANGGSGGGTTGGTGGASGGTPGTGGTQSAGGSVGGSAGQGGTGGGNNPGGGGGYYGGGAANGAFAGGGGGSSFMSPILTSTSTAASANTGNGSITIIYNIPISGLTGANIGLGLAGTIITGGSTPTATAGTGSATVVGNNTAGYITNSASTANTTLMFSTSTPYSNPAYFNPPICTASVASGTAYAIKVAATTSTVVFTPTSNFVTSTVMNYMCLGI